MEMWGLGVTEVKPKMQFPTNNVKVDVDVTSVVARC
jgi:hypothetical protein